MNITAAVHSHQNPGHYSLGYAIGYGNTVDDLWLEQPLDVVDSDTFEADDDWDHAVQLPQGHSDPHNFHHEGDVDWGYFQVTNSGYYKFSTSNLGIYCDTKMFLYGPGSILSPGALIAEDDNSGGAKESLIYAQLDPGTYYLKIVNVSENKEALFGADYRVGVNPPQLFNTGTLDGYVRDSGTNAPLSGAIVRIGLGANSWMTTTTNIAGYFEFLGSVPAGRDYAQVAMKPGYNTLTGTWPEIGSGERVTVNVYLDQNTWTGTLRGQVTDDGVPVSGLRVVAGFSQTMTDSNGEYLFALYPGQYNVESLDYCYTSHLSPPIVVQSQQTTYHDFQVEGYDEDGDGLKCAEEDSVGSSDLDWDSDGDDLPDLYEVGNMSGATPLDPTSADGDLDFDGDGNSNKDEYYNGTDPWSQDPVPDPLREPGCYYWGDSDGDGVVAPGDIAKLQLEIAGNAQDYSAVLPPVFEPLDMDKDGSSGPGDKALLDLMLTGGDRIAAYPAAPTSLVLLTESHMDASVGDTVRVSVSVRNEYGKTDTSGGFAVVFRIDEALSTGEAEILGGDGEDAAEPSSNRFDISAASEDNGIASVTLRLTQIGSVIVRVGMPGCGTYPAGRWCDPVDLGQLVTINAQ